MRFRRWVLAGLALALTHCTNDPYPEADAGLRVRYQALPGAIKTLDPAVSYTVLEHAITAQVYETLLGYHYLRRPYELIPGLATAVPEARTLPDGRVSYRFQLRPDMLYQADPCFELGEAGATTREIRAADVAFELMRIADPEVGSPVVTTFSKIVGFEGFSQRLAERRESDPNFAALRIDRQYAALGGVEGLRVGGHHELEIVLSEPYPQLLYWFAMPFTAPVPWEAVAYYDGEDGRDFFREHPVSTGPFEISVLDKQSRIVLARNPNWYGALHPEWQAPGAIYPSDGEAGDAESGWLDPEYVGRPLPFLDRIEFRIEKEDIPLFNKFLQGYYDASGIVKESFDKVIQEGELSPEMASRGMNLVKSVEPSVFYIGFNMRDPLVGTPGGERSRKLRQAMSLAVDVVEFDRIFSNGRGVPAQSPIPPGIYGYDADYRNPYRTPDLERAQALLVEAGYPGGIDPETGAPLRLTYDIGDTSTRTRLTVQFFVDAWKQLGLDVQIEATNYNRFREKTREGSYQIFQWGWIADYPDPENFLFLLWGEMAAAKNPGAPNTANFVDPRFDALFLEMKDLPNGPRRQALIRRMLEILEVERPWIELSHRENFALYHQWLRNVKPAGLSLPTGKYVDVEPEQRAQQRLAWNRPVTWPAYALALVGVAVVIPGIVTFFRERQ
jgi:oligopeptide transport system substrate-binding protein